MTHHTVLIAGGTGFIGTHLAEELSKKHTVRVLSRSQQAPHTTFETFLWDPVRGEYDERAFLNTTVIINLSGANIGAKRWTSAQKKRIVKSRTDALKTLRTAIENHGTSVTHVISASASGYYGSNKTCILYTEEHEAGNDFPAQVCMAWEQEAQKLQTLVKHLTIARIGLVFDKHQGVFPKIIASLPFRMFGIPGNGKQYIPWIHIDDLVRVFSWIIDTNSEGIWNVNASENTTYNSLATHIQKKKFCFTFHIPSQILKIVLGEMALILTHGTRVSNKKIRNTGFTFSYPTLDRLIDTLL